MNELANEYNNSYHRSIGEKRIAADHFALTELVESNPKDAKFKVNDRVGITNYKKIFT